MTDRSGACFRCGETLFSTVRFCPFCGVRQAAMSPEPIAPLLVPVPPTTPGVPSPSPTAPDLGPPSTPRRPMVAPASVPATPVGDRKERAEPILPMSGNEPSTEPGVWPAGLFAPEPAIGPTSAPQGSARSPQARRRQRGGNPHRAGAIRKLLAAAFVLACAVVLWQQLVATPHGTLTVHLSRPAGGSILLDGIASGSPDSPIAVPPGRHRIGLDAPGFETPSRTIRIAKGETATLELSPSPLPATLSLDSVPFGAAISLDGRAVGRTPLRRTLAPGEHRIRATLPDHLPADRTIVVDPGGSPHLSITLPPVPLRVLHVLAPSGRWSEPVMLPSASRFTVLFRNAVRVRIAGRVILLQPGAPVDLGAADANGISLTAVGSDSVPVDLLIAPDGTGSVE